MKTSYTIVEYYDASVLRKIIPLVESGKIPFGKDEKDLKITSLGLRKFLKNSEMEGDKAKHLTIYEGLPNERLAPKGSLGIGCMPRIIRNAITYGLYYDYDIVNCQPTLILDYAVKNNLSHENILNYVNNRTEFLERNKLDKQDILTGFFNYSIISSNSKEVNDLMNEVFIIREYIYENHRKEFKKIKKDNPKGSVFAKYLQSIERKILDVVYNFFNQSDKIIPAHDGFMPTFTVNLNDLSDYVFEKTTIRVTYAEKPIKKWEHIEEVKEEENYQIGKMKVPKKDYDEWIEKIGDSIFAVKDLKCFCRKVPSDIYDDKVIFQYFTERDTGIIFFDDEDTKKYFKFFAERISKKELCYERFDFLPTPLECNESVKNLWNGWHYDRKNIEVDDTYLPMLHKYLDHISSNDNTVKMFLINWIARIIQYPALKTGVCIFITGDEGGGRGTFYRMMRNMMKDYCLQVTEGEHIFGRFNDILKDAIFVNLDELSPDQFKKYRTKMKNFITDDDTIIETKNKPTIKLRSCSNLLITSNMEYSVVFSKDDRRYVALEIGVMDANFGREFNNLPDEAWHSFFNFFRTIPHNPDINLQQVRPKTDLYNTIRRNGRPYLYTFICYFLHIYKPNISFTTRKLYSTYESYMREQNCKELMKQRGFTDKILKIDGIDVVDKKRDTSGYSYITFDTDKIRKWLVSSGHYTEEEIGLEFDCDIVEEKEEENGIDFVPPIRL